MSIPDKHAERDAAQRNGSRFRSGEHWGVHAQEERIQSIGDAAEEGCRLWGPAVVTG